MSIVLLAVGLLLLALPGALGPLGARVAPSEWSRAVVVCLRVARFAMRGALALAALPILLRAAGAHELAHACSRSATAGLPVPTAISWAAALALAASIARSAGMRRRNAAALVRLRAEPWLGHHRDEDGVDIVTLPCAERLAYAVPGEPDQVIVSHGLLAALDDDEARAVLGHERAHLRHRHHDALTLAGDVEAWMGWFRPARRSVAALRLAVERWADEEAGSASASARPAVRRALLKTVALAIESVPYVPSFTDAWTIAARLDALASSPPAPSVRLRVAATGPMLGLSILAVAAIAACAVVAHHGVDGLLGYCPL